MRKSDKGDKSGHSCFPQPAKEQESGFPRARNNTPEESGPRLYPAQCTTLLYTTLGTTLLYTTLGTTLPWVHPALPCVHYPAREASGKPPGSLTGSPEQVFKAGKPGSLIPDKSDDSGLPADAAGRPRPAASPCPENTPWAQRLPGAWVGGSRELRSPELSPFFERNRSGSPRRRGQNG